MLINATSHYLVSFSKFMEFSIRTVIMIAEGKSKFILKGGGLLESHTLIFRVMQKLLW